MVFFENPTDLFLLEFNLSWSQLAGDQCIVWCRFNCLSRWSMKRQTNVVCMAEELVHERGDELVLSTKSSMSVTQPSGDVHGVDEMKRVLDDGLAPGPVCNMSVAQLIEDIHGVCMMEKHERGDGLVLSADDDMSTAQWKW
jgi:hypothetical protein